MSAYRTLGRATWRTVAQVVVLVLVMLVIQVVR